MNTHRRQSIAAFTRLELILVIAVVVILAVLLLPVILPQKHNHDPIIRCVSNLKQVGLSFLLWAGDNGEKYPMEVPVANGGTLEFTNEGTVAPHFAVMSNELGSPVILACRADASRQAATNFASLQNSNVSYFINLTATPNKPDTWLAGDRYVMVGQTNVQGLFEVNTNSQVYWSENMHKKRGAIAFADGSVSVLIYSTPKLIDTLRRQTNGPSRLVFP